MAIVVLRPQMDLIARANELRRDSNLVAIASNATLKHIVHAQFLANLLNTFRGVFVGHGAGARNDPKQLGAQGPELRDYFLGESIAEVLLAGISTQVLEGEYGEHYV